MWLNKAKFGQVLAEIVKHFDQFAFLVSSASATDAKKKFLYSLVCAPLVHHEASLSSVLVLVLVLGLVLLLLLVLVLALGLGLGLALALALVAPDNQPTNNNKKAKLAFMWLPPQGGSAWAANNQPPSPPPPPQRSKTFPVENASNVK